MGVRVEVTMSNNIDRLFEDIQVDLVQGINMAAERGLAHALELVPFDEGTLAQSGTVERATTPEEGAAIVFDTPYAKRLHEHPEYNFSKDSNPNAQGKYLEDGVVKNRKELGDIIRKQVRGG